MGTQPLHECENCHQPVLVEAPDEPRLCPKCRPRRRGAPRKDNARTERIDVRLTIEGMNWVDANRGSWSRSEYVRRALAKAHDLRGPK